MAKNTKNTVKTLTNNVNGTNEPQPSQETLQAAQTALANGQTQPEATAPTVAAKRVHGPYASEAEAKAKPVLYTEGKNKGQPLAVYAVSLNHYPTVYFYGMNYHHASILALKHWGGTVSMTGGSGRGSAVAAANGRATEAEMHRAAAERDKIAAQQVADSMVSQMVLLIRSMPETMRQTAIDGIADKSIRDRVTAGLTV